MSDGEDGWRSGITTLACGHEVLRADQIHYCTYISLKGLERIVRPFADEVNHARDPLAFGEELFVAAHQASEIAFGQVVRSLLAARARLDEHWKSDGFRCGGTYAQRGANWFKVAVSVFQPLNTLDDFGLFRKQLAPASGAESINFRRIELIAALREESPYVSERGELYTYRALLDRGPGLGPNDPKTRWWTDELTELARVPTLWERFLALCERYELTLDELFRIFYENEVQEHDEKDDAKLLICHALKPLCKALLDLEDAYHQWRMHHIGMALRQIGKLPGTGHTSGVPYLQEVSKLVVLFPGLKDASQKYRPVPQEAGKLGGW